MYHICVSHLCTASMYQINVSHLCVVSVYRLHVSHLGKTSMDQAHVSHLCIAYLDHTGTHLTVRVLCWGNCPRLRRPRLRCLRLRRCRLRRRRSHRYSIVPKTKYMTLGPKFFCCSKMTITRRRKHLHQKEKYSREALDEL